jgi:hypothetical protein
MSDIDFRCLRCGKMCDVVEEIAIDREPYGDQMVERRTYEYWSVCCRGDVEFLEIEETLH